LRVGANVLDRKLMNPVFDLYLIVIEVHRKFSHEAMLLVGNTIHHIR
jgi:hypothetical protein